MAHTEEVKKYYSAQIQQLKEEEKKANLSYLIFSLSRLVIFIAIGLTIFFIYPSNIIVWLVIGGLVVFLASVRLSVDKKYQRDKIREKISINQEEISALEGDHSSFDGGIQFKTPGHPYTEDLDMWGEESVYQMLNRTVSNLGAQKLAQQLSEGKDDFHINRDGIEEMMHHVQWSQDFRAEGRMHKTEENESRLLSFLKGVDVKVNRIFFLLLGIVFPLLAVLCVVALNQDWINFTQFILASVVVLIPTGILLKKTQSLAKEILPYEGRIAIIKKQLALYQKLNIKNANILKHQNSMFKGGEDATSQGVDSLDKIYKGFEFRNNAIVGILLNYFLAWDIHLILRYQKWHEKYSEKLQNWEEKLADIEVWISGATFARHKKHWCFAEFTESNQLEISQMRHPFVEEEKAVPNDAVISESENFHIITGPNMAGKSTYLRSLGLCFVLANAGFPIPAEKCKIPQLKLYSSMRTADDLTQESSYFHAELSRLKFIVSAIERGEKVFIILDEILKGTNSHDKAQGSAKFLEKLKNLNAKGVIATHDLSLCELAKNDTAFKNVYFDSTIENDELSFDYKLRDGICQNMNASFLLEQMGLV